MEWKSCYSGKSLLLVHDNALIDEMILGGEMLVEMIIRGQMLVEW